MRPNTPFRMIAGLLLAACATPLPAQNPSAERPARQAPDTPPPVPAGVAAHRDLAYVANAHVRQKLDLYVPENAPAPLPLIVWIHGGGWASGSKNGCPPLRAGFTARGYAVASLDYRLSGDAIFPAAVEDCKAALRWLRAHAKEFNLDPDRIGVWGSSAGGHLAAFLGASGDTKEFDVGENLDFSSAVQATVDYYGPTDFIQMDAHAVPGSRLIHDNPTSPESRFIGGPIQDTANRSKVQRANPITYVTPNDPPALIVHGDQDPAVPHHQSELFYAALVKAGVPVRFITVKGGGHGQGFPGEELNPIVGEFFSRHLLGNKEAAGWPKAMTSTVNATASGGAPEAPAVSTTRPAEAAPAAPSTSAPSGQRRPPSFDQILRDDTNGDGRVSRDEWKGPPRLFERLDRNADGAITRDEAPSPPAAASPSSAATNTGPVLSAMAKLPGFQLKDERWTSEAGSQRLSGILVKPAGSGPFPAVILSHGLGGSAEGLLPRAQELAAAGFVAIATDYTHAGQGKMRNPDNAFSPENVRRALACFDILAAQPEVDAKRICAWGFSMGAILTTGFAAEHPGKLAAVAIMAGGIQENPERLYASVEKARSIRTPFLMLHGEADTRVVPDSSALLKRVLDGSGVVNDRVTYPGVDHPGILRETDANARVLAWFKRFTAAPAQP